MTPVIRIVDDDASFRASLERLLRAMDLEVRSYASAGELLAEPDPDLPGCVVTDFAMPGMTGLDLQAAMTTRGIHLPVVFISGQSDVPTSVRAIKTGAVDFLTKPLKLEELRAAIRAAIDLDAQGRARDIQLAQLRARLDRLTPRELEVMKHVVIGKLNKQIAQDLGTVEHTVKIHRGRVMRKLEVDSVPELVLFAIELGLVHLQYPASATGSMQLNATADPGTSSDAVDESSMKA